MNNITFLTPYLSGEQMMRVHLASIRKYYPDAPILVSSRGNEEEMERHKQEFGIKYWVESLYYVEAMQELYRRAETDIICISDHDTVLLSDIDYLIDGLDKEWDLVGIEERIKHPWADTWMRYAPGYTDMTFMIFDLRKFVNRFGYQGMKYEPKDVNISKESHYGICENLKRHKYLTPYHTDNYGMGNLLKDGDKDILWHQWYGSYRVRPITPSGDRVALFGGKEYLQKAEENFLQDYPKLNFNNLRKACE